MSFMRIVTPSLVLVLFTACTGQIPGSFRYVQQLQVFSSLQQINTKIDLLWVVDNSSSMDVSQSKLRAGFQGFATKYMKPTWDIRIAVISTDTYLANPAFGAYLTTTVPGSTGYISPYIASHLATFQNPSWNPSLVNLATGALTSGIKYGEISPLWGSSFARLLPGIHDGPITAFCFEPMPYFFNGVTQCTVRDQRTQTGTSHCINPASGESSLSQCVNTVQNDTVRSGKAIISTMPPSGTPGDSTWTQTLVENFMINASTGSSGNGSERGLSSVLQILADNESTGTAFFRKNSLRGIIFLSDEDDQSMVIPSIPPAGYKPFTGYKCDQAGLIALNGSAAVTGMNGLCCADPSKNCSFGSEGTSCPSKTVDGHTFTLGICADPAQLIPVTQVKDELDTFFKTLDGTGSTDPNYFVATLTLTDAAAIQTVQAARYTGDLAIGLNRITEANRADRYIQLGQLVSGNSLALDLSSSDYSPILDAIGKEIIQKKSTFTLSRAPTNKDEMVVKILHQDGSETLVPSSYFEILGKSIVFTNPDFVLSFSATDRISIDYQPTTPTKGS